MIISEDNYLQHYGILRKSGRYPWGSGGTPEHRSRTFLDMVDELRKQGMTATEIAAGFGMTTTELRDTNTIARNAKKQADIAFAQRLKDKGYSNVAIGKRMNIGESSVRALLKPGEQDKLDVLTSTADLLRQQVAEKGFIDVGRGVANQLHISNEKLGTAVSILKDEGYEVHPVQIDQLGTSAGDKTRMKVLCPPGTTYKDVVTQKDKIQQIKSYSPDGGRNFLGIEPPLPVSSKRIAVRYKEQGGEDADGVIYVRPGVEDLSLGGVRYAQVRISVEGTHYLKGMAMYKDDLPEGVDLMFNTNKSDTGNKLDAMKPMGSDPNNPFTSAVRQIGDLNPDGTFKRLTSAMNLVNEEGDWGKWSKTLSSQMLSKQRPALAKEQLDKAYAEKKEDFDKIMNLTNPVVKKKLLATFADGADSSSVHMKAAAMPRQGSHVILPVNSLKPTEIYAPNYTNGDRVVLIRYPHGGKFEIPELIVNNNHREAKKILGDAPDAVGIHSSVAAKLSGADFDGDTVLVIPNNNNKIKTSLSLEGLKNFDPKRAYPKYDGMKRMTKQGTQMEMGIVSNLITDMTIKGASDDELARAVRHSMVVIDAEKHYLNYKQSAIDNGISQLKAKYQSGPRGGASTIISRKKTTVTIPKRTPRAAKDGGPIDKATGRKMYTPTGESYVDKKTGKTVVRSMRVNKLMEATDAHTLSSGTKIEGIYADHSNRLKALADTARKELVNTRDTPYSPSARVAYSSEVQRLTAALNLAKENAPRERQAQILAAAMVEETRRSNPDMTNAEIKKLKGKALALARVRTQAKKARIEISPREWEAIQAGAISSHKLSEILDNANLDQVKALAMPKSQLLMTSSKVLKARAMLDAGNSQGEVAKALGVSLTTLKNSLKDGG